MTTTHIGSVARRLVSGAALALGGLALLGTPAALAGTGGTATIVDQSNNPLTTGGSQSTWTFKLSTPANCSGDSATGGYFVYSYVTPVANAPSSLSFDPTNGPSQPAGSFAYPLVDTTGSPYISHNTAVNTGQVIDFPALAFNWAVFSIDGTTGPAALPAGDYNVGIACAKNGVIDNWWNSVLTFTASNTDPNGETWQVSPGNPVPEAPANVLLPASAAGVIGLGALVVTRRRRGRPVVAAG